MYKNFSKYEIYEDGRIWSKVKNKFLKPSKQKNGYIKVNLIDNEGKKHTERLHKVTFFAVNGLWEYPEGMQINHKDENKENNHINNLELVTAKENINFGTRNERHAKAMKGKIPAANPPKRVGVFNADDELVMVFDSTREAGRNGYNQGAVWACCRNCYMSEGNNKYKGLIWRYI